MTRSMIGTLLAALLVIAIVLLAGEADYRDALRERDRYCKMVSEGLWPDFKGTYAEECRVPDAE